ncbi:MAG: hypothetical protein MJ185_02885 [Treponema sp.]|nr:hypothetical protein [Treponema sp.]
MKKKLLITITAVIMTVTKLSATGYPVFDISGWLTALDQLYSQYDMVMNTITTIENQYQQIQQAVERAKSIDWDNISFDGDFDIRNDIKDANKRVNALLTQSRRIKETLTLQSIDCGNGNRYSIADLCGLGENGKNFITAIEDSGNFMTSTMVNSIKAITEGLTPKQKEAIWRKYGISPRNYIFVTQSVNKVKDASAKVLAKVTEQAVELKRTDQLARSNTVLQAAYSQTDSNGNMTEAAANEASLHLTQQVIEELGGVQESINDLADLTASKLIQEENEKQVEADEMRKEIQRQEAFDNRLPDSFIR